MGSIERDLVCVWGVVLPLLFLAYMRLDLGAWFLRTGFYRKGHPSIQVLCVPILMTER